MSVLKKAGYHFRTPNQITSVCRTIIQQFPSISGSEIAIQELMVNAVEHGNLGISYKEKTDLLVSGKIEDEINRRLTDKIYRDRQAFIEIKELDDEVVVYVGDEGDGFDWQPYFEPEIATHDGYHGRGISLSLQFTKSLTYMGNGNKVIAVFSKD